MYRVECLIALPFLAIGSCSDEPVAVPPRERDPLIAQALDDSLMTDPDLSSRNEGAAAISVKTDGGLPIIEASQDDIAAARSEAATLTGGKAPPAPPPAGTVAPLPSNHTPADHLAVLADRTSCRAKLVASSIWAARLPPALPVYPRGATQGATGGDGRSCRVAAVVFTTPVPADEVVAFYWQRASAAGLAPAHLTAGGWSVLQGIQEGQAFDLRAARTGNITTVELATVVG